MLAAPSPHGPNATIVEYGIYEVISEGVKYDHKESTSGYTVVGVDVALIEKTVNVPLKKGITFGFEWEAEELPEVPIGIEMKVRHPQTQKPDGTISEGFIEKFPFFPEKGRIGRRGDYYSLSEDWELLPGEWTLSMIYDGKVLCEKVFHIIEP